MALDFPASPTTGQSFISGGQVWTYNGSGWTSAYQASGTVRQMFTATSGQTSFTVDGGYLANLVDVYQNGVKLINGTDVTVTSGTAVVLAVGATTGDIVEVLGLSSWSASNYLPLAGGTLTGALNGTTATFSGAVAGTTGTFTGSATATALIPSGSTVPSNGMYLSAANTLNLATNTTNQVSISSTGIVTGTAGNLMLVQGTSQNLTSGVAAPFTNIPSWVKRITVSISNLNSATGAGSVNIIQLGTGAGPTYTNTGYVCSAGQFASTSATSAYTTGFGLSNSNAAGRLNSGIATLTLLESSSNTWAFAWTGAFSSGATFALVGGGYVALSGALTALQLTTVTGTDVFSSGKVNIQYE